MALLSASLVVHARRAAVVGLLVGWVVPARAGEDAVTQSRKYYEAGRQSYDEGQYEEALRQFEAGYAVAPRPQFLINLGQTYRKLGKPRLARYMFEKFLAASDDSDPQRAQVTSVIDEIDIEESAPPGASEPTRPLEERSNLPEGSPPRHESPAPARPPVLLIPPALERSLVAPPPPPPVRTRPSRVLSTFALAVGALALVSAIAGTATYAAGYVQYQGKLTECRARRCGPGDIDPITAERSSGIALFTIAAAAAVADAGLWIAVGKRRGARVVVVPSPSGLAVTGLWP